MLERKLWIFSSASFWLHTATQQAVQLAAVPAFSTADFQTTTQVPHEQGRYGNLE